ncbi:MAG: DUF3833 family protein [Magnetospiraceae bacterium]
MNMIAATRHSLAPEAFFLGRSVADGVFEDRFGRVRRRFHLSLHGERRDGAFHLAETTTDDTGAISQRRWVVLQTEAGHYRGTAEDIIGPAVGCLTAKGMHWRYGMRLGPSPLLRHVQVEDWLYDAGPGRGLNRLWFRRFGILLGTATLVIQRGEM